VAGGKLPTKKEKSKRIGRTPPWHRPVLAKKKHRQGGGGKTRGKAFFRTVGVCRNGRRVSSSSKARTRKGIRAEGLKQAQQSNGDKLSPFAGKRPERSRGGVPPHADYKKS